MDAYDHIAEEAALGAEVNEKGKDKAEGPEKETLNAEFQQAYKVISSSPWGARFGAFVGSVRKQGESYYESSRKEYSTVTEQATKSLSGLRENIVNRTRSLSIANNTASANTDQSSSGESSKDGARTGQGQEGLLSKLKKGAAQRIADIEAAEARADEYLLKFGSNIGSFLKDAVTIAPPDDNQEGREVLFEAKGMEEGKRQIYTTRLDAQLHVLHSKPELFKNDPQSDMFAEWSSTFASDKKTEQIAADLERYSELRNTMEKLVPDQVQYPVFWSRYYYLRNELDLEEHRRKELLKGAAAGEEEVGWDEDDESEDEEPSPTKSKRPVDSTDTLLPKEELLKPKNSADRASQADSEASYDVVSGAPSKTPSAAPGSPSKARDMDNNDSDEDWE